MIKNIIFDIGNVMVTFRPDEFISKFVIDKEKISEFSLKIFGSTQWADGDKYNKTIEQINKELCKIYPEDRVIIKKILDSCPNMFQTVNYPENTLSQLKEFGISLYYLSNISESVLNCLKNKHKVFNLFDGGVASYEYQIVKPDEKIYNILLEKYKLKPNESLFIDDLSKNIETAKRLGFNTIHLKKAEDLRTELQKLDWLGKIVVD